MALVSSTYRFGDFIGQEPRKVAERVASDLSAVTTVLSAGNLLALIEQVKQMKLSADQLVEIKLSVAATGSHGPTYTLSAV